MQPAETTLCRVPAQRTREVGGQPGKHARRSILEAGEYSQFLPQSRQQSRSLALEVMGSPTQGLASGCSGLGPLVQFTVTRCFGSGLRPSPLQRLHTPFKRQRQ